MTDMVVLRVYKAYVDTTSIYRLDDQGELNSDGSYDIHLIADDLYTRANIHRQHGRRVRISFDPPFSFELKQRELVSKDDYASLNEAERKIFCDRLKELIG